MIRLFRIASIMALALGLAAPAGWAKSAPQRSLLPVVRPVAGRPPQARPDKMIIVAGGNGVKISLRPIARPRHRPAAAAVAVVSAAPRAIGQTGPVCSRRAIIGQRLAAIPAKLRGCGLAQPVRVSQVSGVRLSTPAIVDCTTAKALDDWVRKGVKPAVGRLGGGVASLTVIASYSCRTRNSQPGAKISEHGKGHAVDIAAITLRNGVSLNVLKNWGRGAKGRLLKQFHRAACGIFGTVLGPNSDRFHRNHFHLDTARYRAGSYCR